FRGKTRPCLSMKALTCWRCTRRVSTAEARARTRSRMASWVSSGTHTGVSSPARNSLASATGIAAVGLHPIAGLPLDERGPPDPTGVTGRGDEPIQAIPGQAGLVAEMDARMLGRNPLDQPAHALCRRVNLTHIAHFTTTPAIRDRHRITRLRNINPYK